MSESESTGGATVLKFPGARSTKRQGLEAENFDVIVVGTGMGGATLGLALARAGRSVLFLEKGRSHLGESNALLDDYAETFFEAPENAAPKHGALLSRAGRCQDPIEDVSGEAPRRFVPFVGSGTGGSTALYGMALERFHPVDFTPARAYADAADSELPERWPIRYEELAPYYTQAESLFGVRGTSDPLRGADRGLLRAPAPMSRGSAELFDFFSDQGLHPYRVPQAGDPHAACPGCQGFLCSRGCKKDSARVCLVPALRDHGARLLDECTVLEVRADRRRARSVVCRRRGQELVLRAETIVLAAGALHTPSVLLRSVSGSWPQGLANDSGLVGRCLMRHYVDLYLVSPRTKDARPTGIKELAFNDFYASDAGKMGTVQSFGALPPADMLVTSLKEESQRKGLGWLAPLLPMGRPLLRALLERGLGGSVALASIQEDLPYRTNWVRPRARDGGCTLHFHIRAQERRRIQRFRELLSGVLRAYRPIRLAQAENNERIAHACGTCRFGEDPKTSVLDPQNRAHGVENLFVVDASFFPSSSGTNPALTIAANALRVASIMEPSAGGALPS